MRFLLLVAVAIAAFAQAPQPPAPAQPSPDIRARAVIGQLAAGQFAAIEGQFNAKIHAAMGPGQLSGAWTTLIAQAGAFQKIDNVSVRPAGEFQVAVAASEFAKARIDIQVVFDRDGKIAGLAFRQAAAAPSPYTLPPYATPASYTESEIRIGTGEWALPGSLDMPVGSGPFPAVVLVHGSGPGDRDETVGAEKPFKDLALGLASHGIAVLRYDKRTKVYGAKMAALPGMTVKEETIDDVGAAVAALTATPRIDPRRIVVIGHSLGGMLIPRIAAVNPSVAGFVAMAGAARPLEDAIQDQTTYLATADGPMTPEKQTQVDEVKKEMDQIRALKPGDSGTYFHAPAGYWLDLRGYDPPTAAKGITRPLLVLQGERDYQVTMPEFERWKTALAGKSNVTFHSYPGLNHLFIAGTGKSLPAEYSVPGHVAEPVVRDIADWINRLSPSR